MPGDTVVAPSPALARFIAAVSFGTGLSAKTVDAWVLAEGGPDDNPLNIGPGKHYGSPEAAAKATVDLLHTPRYAGVIQTAKSTDDPKVELAAIANSPWDLGTVGPKPGYLKLLLGTLARVEHGDGSPKTAAGITSEIGGSGGILGGAVDFIQKESALALAYVALVVLGVAFVLVGVREVLGYSPSRQLSALKPSPSPIPF